MECAILGHMRNHAADPVLRRSKYVNGRLITPRLTAGEQFRMNKNARTSIALVVLGSILVNPATAWGQSDSGLAFVLGFLGGYGSGYYGRAPYAPRYGFLPWYGFVPNYSYGYSYPPAPVIVPAPPPVYIQQPQPLPSQPEAPSSYYWHYCREFEGYYPYVRKCPGGWLRVAPQPAQ
ncbi:hypothetical protein SAMN05216299_108101 [Nitrosospira sp. Nsp14]|nr:hypothetical protein SAMN05216299_108101 [Nitrosospira sp. Nsp14]